jgi:hypothetical protein
LVTGSGLILLQNWAATPWAGQLTGVRKVISISTIHLPFRISIQQHGNSAAHLHKLDTRQY